MKFAAVLIASVMSFSVAQAHDAEALQGEFRKVDSVPGGLFDRQSDANAPETLVITVEDDSLVIRKNADDEITRLVSNGSGSLVISTLKEAIPLSQLNAPRTEKIDEGKNQFGVSYRVRTRSSIKAHVDGIMGSRLLVNVKVERINEAGLIPKREKLVELDTTNGQVLIVRIEGTTAAYLPVAR
ncbi:MAG TPA: hypothetical protein VM432_09085 [Bdellovibrionales bacterium]|nr:hypothetical protein [Bdellovibrionales bacterium]